MLGLIDTHFHLDYYRNHAHIFKEINRLQQYTICVTNSPGIYCSCKNIYSNSRYVKFALGFHPNMRELGKRDFEEFAYLFSESNYIGEVGLDFSNQIQLNKDIQKQNFGKIIEMCAYYKKLVSIHLRKDDGYGIKILEQYRPEKSIIHWFSGNCEELERLICLGCYFSINENMICNSSKSKWLLKIPKERILIESDGPFTKVNGKKYVPQLLYEEYENIARFLDEPDLISIVYDNFFRILK